MSEVHKFYIKGHEVLIDKDKVELVSKYKWYVLSKSKKSNDNYIYIRSNHFIVDGKKTSILLSRLLTNAENGVLVDHINRNSLDNRLCNLRFCTFSENARNTTCRKHSSSKYLGVSIRSKKYKKNIYSAQIKDCKKSIRLGNYKTEIEAAKAYNEAAIKYHGEFANLNKI